MRLNKPSRPFRPARRLLLATTALFALTQAEAADAQGCSGSPCSIPAGSYTQPFASRLATAQPLSFTNQGSFIVTSSAFDSPVTAVQVITSGGDGPNSSSQPAGSGLPASTLSFINRGMVTHGVPAVLQGAQTVFTVYGASAGGNGGNYTNSDAKHDAGDAAAGGQASLTNLSTITVVTAGAPSTPPFTLRNGAALLVESLGGQGGSVTREGSLYENGNPKHDAHNGRAGADWPGCPASRWMRASPSPRQATGRTAFWPSPRAEPAAAAA